MFGSKAPDEIGFFESDDPYGKAVLRQVMRTDTHAYRLLSARLVLDGATMMAFVEQDDRISGQQEQRAEQRYNNVAHHSMQLGKVVPEAVDGEGDINEVGGVLVEDDKEP
jgi:hypothetical protein